MKNKDFDNIDKLAQNAFEDFEVPFNTGDWMAFQDKLDNESAIDTAAKNALANYEVPLDPQGWDDFERLHQKKKGAAFYIWWYKAAEVGAMALLLLGALLNLPCSNTNHTNYSSLAYGSTATLNSSSTSTPSTNVASEHSNNQQESNLITTTSEPTNKDGLEEQEMLNLNHSSVEAIEAPTEENNPGITPVSSIDKSSSKNSTIVDVAANKNRQVVVPNKIEDKTPLNPIASSIDKNTGAITTKNEGAPLNNTSYNNNSNNSQQVEENGLPIQTKSSTTSSLGELLAHSTNELQLKNNLQQLPKIEPITSIGSTELKAPHSCKHYLGTVLGVGANMGTSMGNTSIGYTGGLTYEKEFSRKISLSVGLLGVYKRYDRKDIILLDRSQFDGEVYSINQVKTSNLFLLEIPLEVNYTCFRSDKWRIYATAGLSANAIFSRVYTGSQEVQMDGLTISTDLNSNDFDRGLTEGGEAKENIYLSIGGGIGLERKLGDNLSLYLVPTYKHALNSVHQDWIHTFNVNIGIKKAL